MGHRPGRALARRGSGGGTSSTPARTPPGSPPGSPAQDGEVSTTETRALERVLLEVRLRDGLPLDLVDVDLVDDVVARGSRSARGRLVLTRRGRLLGMRWCGSSSARGAGFPGQPGIPVPCRGCCTDRVTDCLTSPSPDVNHVDIPGSSTYIDTMTTESDLATAASASDPRVGLRAVRALRRLLEELERTQVRRARRAGLVVGRDRRVRSRSAAQAVHKKYGKD